MKKITYILFFIFLNILILPKSAFAVGEFITTWKTDNPGVSTSNQITIPTHTGDTYNYTVNWGDTNSNTGVTGSITHTYSSPGTYTITISGAFPRIYFNNGGDKSKILSVESWGSQVWTSMANAFYGANNLVINAGDAPNLSTVTDMSGMFRDATSVNPDTSSWDFTNVTTVSSMFEGATSFNNSGIAFWFAPVVTNMSNMFKGATSFNQYLGSWDVSSVTNMGGMFEGATSFNQGFIWTTTSSVTNMSNMFKGATSFNGIVNDFNTSSVTDMSSMFEGATSFNQPLDPWNVGNVQSMNSMFNGATSFNQPLNSWNVSSVVDIGYMFSGATSFNQPLNSWNVSNVLSMDSMFQQATSFNQPLNSWDISSSSSIEGMFNSATSFNQPLNSWNVSNLLSLSSLFDSAVSFDQDISDWDVSNVSYMNNMFNGVKLSTTNYDALITKWSALALKSNVTFDGGNSTYCTSATQRASIISTYGWTITDGGTTCSTTVSSRSSHSTAQSRVQNLLAIGNTQAADAIIKQFPDQFNSLDKVVQLCAPDRLITQKLKLGSVDGKYNSYTKGIVKEAKILQAHLNRLGFNAGKEDGNLGPISEKAIKRMQTYFNIQSDGYVGQVTIGFINNSCK